MSIGLLIIIISAAGANLFGVVTCIEEDAVSCSRNTSETALFQIAFHQSATQIEFLIGGQTASVVLDSNPCAGVFVYNATYRLNGRVPADVIAFKLASAVIASTIVLFSTETNLDQSTMQHGNHYILFWSTLLIGAILMLVCDSIAQLPVVIILYQSTRLLPWLEHRSWFGY